MDIVTLKEMKHQNGISLKWKASGLILVHNHPSGSALPSVADISQTQALNRALKTCDLALVDHVVIAKGEYYSFADEIVTPAH